MEVGRRAGRVLGLRGPERGEAGLVGIVNGKVVYRFGLPLGFGRRLFLSIVREGVITEVLVLIWGIWFVCIATEFLLDSFALIGAAQTPNFDRWRSIPSLIIWKRKEGCVSLLSRVLRSTGGARIIRMERRRNSLHLFRWGVVVGGNERGGFAWKKKLNLECRKDDAGVRDRTIDQSAGGKLRDKNTKESWALLEDLALYDNESWNDPRDFAKPVKVIALPQDAPRSCDTDEMEDKVESEEEVEEETEEEAEEETEEEAEEEEEGNLEHELSVIDHYLGSVVFGKPFMEATGLVYNKEEGTVVFEKDKENIIFKMPYKMDMFKHVDFADRGTDSIPPFIIKSDDDTYEKTYYSNNSRLFRAYTSKVEYACRGIRSLMATKSRRKNKGEVT
ncbi:hypothetical protein Tco_1438808 [Tanacetum coccineum]